MTWTYSRLLSVAVFGIALVAPVTAQRKSAPTARKPAGPLTAQKLILDSDCLEFAGPGFSRDAGSLAKDSSHASVSQMKEDVFSHHMVVYLQTPPASIPKYPDFVKDMVTQSAELARSSGGEDVPCQLEGSPAVACLKIAAPMGSFRENQKSLRIVFGKGRYYVRVEMFRDFEPDTEYAVKLAARILSRLP